MAWKKPVLREISCGMEINMYAPAEDEAASCSDAADAELRGRNAAPHPRPGRGRRRRAAAVELRVPQLRAGARAAEIATLTQSSTGGERRQAGVGDHERLAGYPPAARGDRGAASAGPRAIPSGRAADKRRHRSCRGTVRLREKSAFRLFATAEILSARGRSGVRRARSRLGAARPVRSARRSTSLPG